MHLQFQMVNMIQAYYENVNKIITKIDLFTCDNIFYNLNIKICRTFKKKVGY